MSLFQKDVSLFIQELQEFMQVVFVSVQRDMFLFIQEFKVSRLEHLLRTKSKVKPVSVGLELFLELVTRYFGARLELRST